MPGKSLNHINTLWQQVERPPSLSINEVHVWRASLDNSDEKLQSFWQKLSEDEKDRSQLFKFEQGRNQYITGRGMLRHFLGDYLSEKPANIRFQYNEYGKPLLKENSSLKFNLSHSRGVALFAFTLNAAIGVDIEFSQKKIDVKKLASRFFSKNESRVILNLPKTQQQNAFFKCWTRKESFIKAHGQGLSMPLDQFEVSILDNDEVRLRAIDWNPEEVKEWSMRSFQVEDDKLGALSVKSPIDEIHLMTLKD